MGNHRYVLVTPARNEEAFIEKTLQAVAAQTILPQKWVIVSDCSTDRTDEIVGEFAKQHEFIELVRAAGRNQRTFSSKVHAFNLGYEHLKGKEYAFLGILDADVSFQRDYYERVLAKFEQNQRLGIAGGIRYDWRNGKFQKVSSARNSVGGPVQLFRRQCFDDIGGFIPIAGGGIDAVAEIMARMHGWEVEAFPELEVYHYRRTGSATRNALGVHFHEGVKCRSLGYHPLFHVVKSVYRMKEKPTVIAGLLMLFGYVFASLKGHERPVPENFVTYLRSEQLARLKVLFTRGKDPALWC